MTTPEPGEFGVCWTRDLYGYLIRWGTCPAPWWQFWKLAPVDHAFIYVGEGRIVEARMGGVRVAAWDSYPGTVWSGNSVPLDAAQREGICQTALSFVGRPYNILDIAAIALAQRRLGRRIDGNEWWVRRLSNPSHLICSQLVDQSYEDNGIALFPGRLPGLVSPMDLLSYIEEHG